MAQAYELMIGLRYTRAKKSNHFISFISLISMLGVALGVMTLIVVLSVMNGFQTELRTRILAVVSHVQIMGAFGEMPNWRYVADQSSKHPEVIAAAPFIQEQGLLSYGPTARGAMIRGIIPELEAQVSDIHRHMVTGNMDSLSSGSFNIVLGSDLARTLRVSVGEKITLIAPQGLMTPAGMIPRLRTFTVSGIFNMDMSEFDSGLALINLEDAQRLYRMDEQVTGVRLKLNDLFKAPLVVRQLAVTLDVPAYLSDWTRSHANFFRAVQLEKRMMFIILSLIVAVAVFNIVSTLVMAVVDKQADIAILRTLGASPGSIMKIFVIQGAIIGCIGLAMGVISGITIALNIDVIVPAIERLLGREFIDKTTYFISHLPSELQWKDVTTVTGTAFVLSLLATLYPSWRASRVNPAEALRYE